MIIAASIHEERHQDSAINFICAHLDQLRSKPSAFVSVSLSAATTDGQVEAQEYVDRFTAVTGWSPTKTLLLAGALPLSQCDYFQRQVLKQILTKLGADLDQSVNYEFTNWTGLKTFIDHFFTNA